MTQYFFVDESGEPGFQKFRGFPYFIMAMVQAPSWEPLDELAELRRDLYLLPSFEFHYAKMSSIQKDTFYHAVLPVYFRVRAAVMLKEYAPSRYREMNEFDLTVELLSTLTLRALPSDVSNNVLIIDGATDALRSALRIRVSGECRKMKRERLFKKIVTASSRQEDGLQLADMVAGAIRERAWENEPAYFRTFDRKVVDLWGVSKTPRLSQDLLEKTASLGNLFT